MPWKLEIAENEARKGRETSAHGLGKAPKDQGSSHLYKHLPVSDLRIIQAPFHPDHPANQRLAGPREDNQRPRLRAVSWPGASRGGAKSELFRGREGQTALAFKKPLEPPVLGAVLAADDPGRDPLAHLPAKPPAFDPILPTD